MNWIYLSPHLDDVALSAGGLVWEQTQAGENISILTLFAGDPAPGPLSPFAESLHARWGVGREAMAVRREEDFRACQILGATPYHFSIPDCIYRTINGTDLYLYASEESLFGNIHPAEESLIQHLRELIEQNLPRNAQVVCPLALGGHVDHQLTRAAAEALGIPVRYYADYPYLLEEIHWDPGKFKTSLQPVSEAGITAWQTAVAEHRSQISTFWQNEDEMKRAIRAYAEEIGGVKIWAQAEHNF